MNVPGRSPRVFVYGTLLRGQSNHRLLEDATFVGETRTEVGFELVDLGPFPAMVRRGDARVVGEEYEVGANTLAALDRLEGHPRFYRRRDIRLENGGAAQAYLFSTTKARDLPVIASGDWRQKRREQYS